MERTTKPHVNYKQARGRLKIPPTHHPVDISSRCRYQQPIASRLASASISHPPRPNKALAARAPLFGPCLGTHVNPRAHLHLTATVGPPGVCLPPPEASACLAAIFGRIQKPGCGGVRRTPTTPPSTLNHGSASLTTGRADAPLRHGADSPFLRASNGHLRFHDGGQVANLNRAYPILTRERCIPVSDELT